MSFKSSILHTGYNTNMQEEWRPVIGYEGYYEVSNFGGLVSLHKGRIKKTPVKAKYLNSFLYKEGESRNFYIHRLVAVAFVANPMKKECVNHKDLDKYNNHYLNLEWCSKKENTIHAYIGGAIKKYKRREGEESLHSKLTNKQVLQIVKLSREGLNQVELSKKFSVTPTAIGYILNGRNWGSVTGLPRTFRHKL